ncbi:MAG: VCBS repeat-containing protein [Polyangiales bacterium]
MQRSLAFGSLFAFLALACGKKSEPPSAEPARTEQAATPADAGAAAALPVDASAPPDDPEADEPRRGVALALSTTGKDGKKHARTELLFLRPKSGKWETVAFDDPTSNAFYKVLSLLSSIEESQVITFGGDKAAVKGWRRTAAGFTPTAHWAEKVGVKLDRMRDAELGDVDNNNAIDIVVSTHDQGVLAVLKRNPAKLTEWKVEKLDRAKNTFLEEIELGDLDQDGNLEIYTIPRDAVVPKAGESKGRVLRYVPSKKEKRTVVVALDDRQARELLVQDVDGDGKDELYVSVEALMKGEGDATELVEGTEIRRYKASTAPDDGEIIARIPDAYCRALTAGDIDGDGHRELVAACARTGVWVFQHGGLPEQAWSVQQLDKEPTGLQQAAVLADLDENGRDELYVSADDQGEVRRYTWEGGKAAREVIVKRAEGGPPFTTYAITMVGR